MFAMKFWLVTILALLVLLPSFMLHTSFAEKGTFVNEVKFIQYLDENTALEEVRNGNLDIYFFRVSSDRIETEKDREGIQVFESTGGSYSMLVNPSISETFNPFSITELRFALNYLVDRNLIVNELIGGYGNTMISNYGIFAADYLSIIDELESFHFKYNPALANEIISEELEKAGAEKIDGFSRAVRMARTRAWAIEIYPMASPAESNSNESSFLYPGSRGSRSSTMGSAYQPGCTDVPMPL